MSIRCFFQGHDLRKAYYKGAPERLHMGMYGFFHFGLCSQCERCGKEIRDVESLKLPVITPYADGEHVVYEGAAVREVARAMIPHPQQPRATK